MVFVWTLLKGLPRLQGTECDGDREIVCWGMAPADPCVARVVVLGTSGVFVSLLSCRSHDPAMQGID